MQLPRCLGVRIKGSSRWVSGLKQTGSLTLLSKRRFLTGTQLANAANWQGGFRGAVFLGFQVMRVLVLSFDLAEMGSPQCPPALVRERRDTSAGPSRPTEAADWPQTHHHHLLASSLLRVQTKSIQTHHP